MVDFNLMDESIHFTALSKLAEGIESPNGILVIYKRP